MVIHMRLIKNIEIEGFRSIKKAKLNNLTDFTTIAGLNSAGKSNILRAISLFFTGEKEPGKGFNPTLDYHFSKSRPKKKVSITVEFEIPNNFHYHNDVSFSKHSQVKGFFNREYIKTEILPKKFGKTYNKVFEFRQKFDYIDLAVPEKEMIVDYINLANEFINVIHKFLHDNNLIKN